MKLTYEQMNQMKLMSKWAHKVKVFSVFKAIYDRYILFKKRKEEEDKKIISAVKLVLAAKRFFTNAKNQWGKTYEQRLQLKISNSMLHLFSLRHDHAETMAKQRMLQFLRAMSSRMHLS